MVKIVNVHEAKTTFSRLLRRVERGEEVVIGKAGKPVARLVPNSPAASARAPGSAKGRLKLRADFDAPLPKALREALGG